MITLNAKKNLVLSAAVMGLTLGAASSAQANIVTDGNFTNIGANWNPNGNFLYTDYSHPDGAITTAIGMGTVGYFGNVSQTLATNPGTTYRISFDLEHPYIDSYFVGGGNTGFQALFGSNTLLSLIPIGYMPNYTAYTFTSLASNASTLLRFNEREDPAYIYLTNVSVSAVPLPASVQMFGLGLLGLVGFAYYNRRKNGFVA